MNLLKFSNKPMLFWCVLFVIYEYTLRLSDSVIIDQLHISLHASMTQISVLSSSYYIAYVAMLIPAGFLLDRLSVRLLLIVSCSICTTFCLVFGNAQSLEVASFSRFFMGAASSFAFLSFIKLVAENSPSAVYGRTIALVMVITTLGAVFGQKPWQYFVSQLGSWRTAYSYAAIYGAIVTIGLACTKHYGSKTENQNFHFNRLFKKLFNADTIPLLLYVMMLSTPFTAFIAFWAMPLLTKYHHISSSTAATMCSSTWVTGLLGNILVGWLYDKYQQQFRWLCLTFGLLVALLVTATLLPVNNVIYFAVVIALLGFVCNTNVIIFSEMLKRFQHQRGTVVGVVNMFNMVGGPIFQLIIGFLVYHLSLSFQHSASVIALSCLVIPAAIILSSIGLLVVGSNKH